MVFIISLNTIIKDHNNFTFISTAQAIQIKTKSKSQIQINQQLESHAQNLNVQQIQLSSQFTGSQFEPYDQLPNQSGQHNEKTSNSNNKLDQQTLSKLGQVLSSDSNSINQLLSQDQELPKRGHTKAQKSHQTKQSKGVSFAQTDSLSQSSIIERSKSNTNQQAQSTAQVSASQGASEQVQTNLQAKGGTTFFYIDDFFYWLGCKFVTCDKPALRHDPPEAKKDKDQPAEQKSKSLGAQNLKNIASSSPKTSTKFQAKKHDSENDQKSKTQLPLNNPEVKEMNEEVQKIDELLKDDQDAVSHVQHSKLHRLMDTDSSDSEKIDEQSIAADSLKELNKLSEEIDKNVSNHKINKSKKGKSAEKKQTKVEGEKVAKENKDKAHKTLKEVTVSPDDKSLKHKESASKAQEPHEILKVKKNDSNLEKSHKDLEKKQTAQASESKTSKQVKSNNLNLGDHASKLLEKVEPAIKESAVVETKPLKFANKNEVNQFSNKNPFADFTIFESNVDNMQPILPDQATKMMTQKVEQRIKNIESSKGSTIRGVQQNRANVYINRRNFNIKHLPDSKQNLKSLIRPGNPDSIQKLQAIDKVDMPVKIESKIEPPHLQQTDLNKFVDQNIRRGIIRQGQSQQHSIAAISSPQEERASTIDSQDQKLSVNQQIKDREVLKKALEEDEIKPIQAPSHLSLTTNRDAVIQSQAIQGKNTNQAPREEESNSSTKEEARQAPTPKNTSSDQTQQQMNQGIQQIQNVVQPQFQTQQFPQQPFFQGQMQQPLMFNPAMTGGFPYQMEQPMLQPGFDQFQPQTGPFLGQAIMAPQQMGMAGMPTFMAQQTQPEEMGMQSEFQNIPQQNSFMMQPYVSDMF